MHRQTDRQTDRRHRDANSRAYVELSLATHVSHIIRLTDTSRLGKFICCSHALVLVLVQSRLDYSNAVIAMLRSHC